MSKRVRKYTKSNPASFISSKIWQVIELTIGQKVTPRPIRGQYNDVTAAINRGCQRGQSVNESWADNISWSSANQHVEIAVVRGKMAEIHHAADAHHVVGRRTTRYNR